MHAVVRPDLCKHYTVIVVDVCALLVGWCEHWRHGRPSSSKLCDLLSIDVINVYNVYKKNLCKRVYYFVNVYLNKNHMS